MGMCDDISQVAAVALNIVEIYLNGGGKRGLDLAKTCGRDDWVWLKHEEGQIRFTESKP